MVRAEQLVRPVQPANEAGTISATGVTNGVFVPDDNINEDVYGPPADME